MKSFITHCFLFFTILYAAQAQEPAFKVSINVDSVLMGNRFEVSFTLENAQGQTFRAPDFNNFQVVSGPNQSSSFSMVNGTVSQSLTYSYYLEPKEVGSYYIEEASIDIDGETLYTLPLEVWVLPNPDGIIQRPNRPKSEFDFFNRQELDWPKEPARKPKKKKRKIYRI